MDVFFSEAQLRHCPQQFMVRGRLVAPVETPERARRLADRIAALGLSIIAPEDRGTAAISAVHDAAYLTFLASAHERFSKLPGAGSEVLPNIHPYVGAGASYASRERPRSSSVVAEAGWYLGDLAVAMGEDGRWHYTRKDGTPI